MKIFSLNIPGNHTLEYSILIVAAVLLLALFVTFAINLKAKTNYDKRWNEIQQLLSNKESWKKALIEADRLLDSALKKRHFKGKTMGERLVAAQHEIKFNDMVWFSHKLTNKVANEGIKLNKTDLKKALLGFWKALKDLGVFIKEDE